MNTIRTDTTELLCHDVTREIIGSFYDVYNELRFGFLERVYSCALRLEFEKRGLFFVAEQPLEVLYKGAVVGLHRPDFLVSRRVVVEIKAIKELTDADKRQLLHYLRATNMEVGLLLNFGPEAKFHRTVLTKKDQR